MKREIVPKHSNSSDMSVDSTLIEKIEKSIYYPCSGLVLKHIVTLGKMGKKDKKRMSDINIYSYKTNKYTDRSKVYGISIDSNDYLVFEYIGRNKIKTENNSVFISYPHYSMVQKTMNEATEWFDSNVHPNLFKINKTGNVYIGKSYRETELFIGGLSNNGWLLFRPTLVETDDGIIEGVEMNIGSDSKSVLLTGNEFLSMVTFINNFSLYQSSLLLQMLGHTLGTNYNLTHGKDEE